MFRSPEVTRLIQGLDSTKQQISGIVREIILDAGPGIEESIKYGVPYYTYHGPLCYLHYPVRTTHVALGFTKGASMVDETMLLSGDGKVVRHYIIEHPNNIDEGRLKRALQEALLLNEWTVKNRKRSR